MPWIQYQDHQIPFKDYQSLQQFDSSFIQDVLSCMKSWFDGGAFIDFSTSGTTSAPKIIQKSRSQVACSARATADYFDLESDSTALLCLSPKYVAGRMMIYRAIVNEWNLMLVDPSSNPVSHLDIAIDFAAFVPLQLQYAIKDSLPKLKLIKTLIVGGATINKELELKTLSLGFTCYETFGMTETLTHVAVRKFGSKSRAFSALPHVRFSQNEEGCLIVEARGVADQPQITRDMVDLIDEQHFRWLGRIDNVINSGGIKIIPEILETKLKPFIQERFFITGIKDEFLGQRLVLIIEGEKWSRQMRDGFESSIQSNLEKHEKPKEIIFTETLKETPSGKIIRNIPMP